MHSFYQDLILVCYLYICAKLWDNILIEYPFFFVKRILIIKFLILNILFLLFLPLLLLFRFDYYLFSLFLPDLIILHLKLKVPLRYLQAFCVNRGISRLERYDFHNFGNISRGDHYHPVWWLIRVYDSLTHFVFFCCQERGQR